MAVSVLFSGGTAVVDANGNTFHTGTSLLATVSGLAMCSGCWSINTVGYSTNGTDPATFNTAHTLTYGQPLLCPTCRFGRSFTYSATPVPPCSGSTHTARLQATFYGTFWDFFIIAGPFVGCNGNTPVPDAILFHGRSSDICLPQTFDNLVGACGSTYSHAMFGTTPRVIATGGSVTIENLCPPSS